jgi:ribA/ribD-fused uncharacterized protein
MQDAIREFKGEFDFLRNFYFIPQCMNGIMYKTNEHFYQSMKSTKSEIQEHIRNMHHPGDAKKAGRQVALRKNWNQLKTVIMLDGLRSKFYGNSGLLNKLLATGNRELIEGNNWHDNFWGDCSCTKCITIPGRNVLGKLLMLIRQEHNDGFMKATKF